MDRELLTAEDVNKRCFELGFEISKPGFAQYIADICNRPLRIEPIPIYSTNDPMPMILRNGWLYR